MKLVFLNQTFYPDFAATAQYLTDAAIRFSEDGHEVTVICGRQSYLEPQVRHAACEHYRGVTIHRTGSLGFARKGKVRRMLHALGQNLGFAWKLFTLPKQDRIVALTSPPLIIAIAAAVGALRRTSVIHWAMDVNPEQVIRAGWLRRGSVPARLLACILRISLRRCRRVIAIDDDMRSLLIEKGAPRERTRVAHLWCMDYAAASSAAGGPGASSDKFVILYSGNHSIVHPLTTLLGAALALKDRSEIEFVFAGGGDRKSDVLRFKELHGLSNITCLTYLEREEYWQALQAADLHAVVMGEEYAGVLHPSKIYAALAAGRPVLFIGPKQSHIGRLISEYGNGWCVEHGDTARCTSAILELLRMRPEEVRGLRERSKQAALKFDREKGLTELLSAISGV